MSLTLNFFFFPIRCDWNYFFKLPLDQLCRFVVDSISLLILLSISLIRVALNRKISATVGWMQMSAPSISLYALTIMAQPSFEEEHPDVTHFQKVHRMIYM